MPLTDWYLERQERGNPSTALDSRRADGTAWSTGNLVEPLVHGACYFESLYREIEAMAHGDFLCFADWRGDPDELLTDDPDSGVGETLARAAARGVDVRGLIWRSHLDRFQFSAEENRHLGKEIEAAGGECLLDMRVRVGGSHHQKFVVLRHPDRPDLDCAFLGGIDLCHSRRDDAAHRGDPQTQPMAAIYGSRPPWHDIQLRIRGPAVGDVEAVFRERWNDDRPLSRSPFRWLADHVRGDDRTPGALPPQLPDPEPQGPHSVQLLRTYPRRFGGYSFAPDGERSIARGYAKAVERARRLIYIEDQYLWSIDVAEVLTRALERVPSLRLVAVLPHYPDQDGRVSTPPNLIGRHEALSLLTRAAGDRVAFYGVENVEGVPVYVHAKVCIVDDVWASVGSDNFNRRSWTHDSELTAAVWDHTLDQREPSEIGALDAPRRYPRDLRLALVSEHLGRRTGDSGDLVDPESFFRAMATSAAELQQWHDSSRSGGRPAGMLRPLDSQWSTVDGPDWARLLYRVVYDPDGRPRRLRRARTF
jgi:phosphatidylserine/phosphatidylglycerophosphate/cardiolipin synthase-like enzyme